MSLQGIFSATGWIRAESQSSIHSAWRRARNASFTCAILRYRVWFIALFHAILLFIGLLAAWLLRFNFLVPDPKLLLSVAPVLVAIRLTTLGRCGLLHGWWRYTGIDDAVAIMKATLIGSVAFLLCVRAAFDNPAFPRTIYFLEPLIDILLLIGIRVFARIVVESLQTKPFPVTKVILIGAGTAAYAALREMAVPGSGYRAIGCVDDDLSKVGIKILGVPVLATVNDLPALAEKHGIKEVLIAVPSATKDQMQRFADVCRKAQLWFRVFPSMRGIPNECFDFPPSQEADLENLLGRDPVKIDLESVRNQIEGQIILVTGAAGTIGSELCRRVLQFSPAKLVCLDRNETGVFYLQMELLGEYASTPLVFCVTDFGDGERMRSILAQHKPSIILHAAAYKHVPMMENNVYDAVKNNIFGLLQLFEIAEDSGCSGFVLISSDKAVNPSNIMGATKRVGELMISRRPAGCMRCVCVRFGNVLGSNGSVVPVLQKQIRNHQQLTITHPDVARFFMTTQEAASLVLEAFAIGNHADTLLLEMGSPVRILDLAKTLIRLSGKSEPEIDIRFTGLRDGEKLVEELSYPSEEIHPTSSPKIGRIRGTPQGWVYLEYHLQQLKQSMTTRSDSTIRDKVKEIVPEYSPRGSISKNGNGLGCVSVNSGQTPAAQAIGPATMALR